MNGWNITGFIVAAVIYLGATRRYGFRAGLAVILTLLLAAAVALWLLQQPPN